MNNPWRLADVLTHLPRVPHICVSELGQHLIIGSGNGLSPVRRQTIYLNQYCLIVKGTFRNNFQWNFNQNTKPFIHENALGNVVCEMTAILSWGRWFNDKYLTMPIIPRHCRNRNFLRISQHGQCWCFLLASCPCAWREHRQTSNISRTLVGNKLADHSDIVALLQLYLHSLLDTWIR